MSSNNFFQEIKRRKVYRVGITYAIIAWLLIQVATVIEPIINAPEWFMKVVLVLLIIGFPVALVLAWAFEISPDGIILSSSQKATDNPMRVEKKHSLTSNILIGILLVLVVGQFVYNRYVNSKQGTVAGDRMSLAVLPLKNLNEKPEFEFFSNGITQELINELAIVRSLELTPFFTSLLYKNDTKPLSEIAEELGVDIFLTGSVQIFEENIKISVELVDPHSNKLIWNDTYDEPLDNAPEIQSSIARRTAEKLNIELTGKEDESLNKTQTKNGMAFRLFLKAKSEIGTFNVGKIAIGDSLLEEALKYDPEYAQAHTLLAWSTVLQSWSWMLDGKKTMAEKKQKIEHHVQRAIEIDPNSSDTYLVRANHKLNTKAKLADARKDVERAIEINSWPRVPTDYCICTAVTVYAISHMLDRAKELANLAHEVDPGNVFIHIDQVLINMVEGNYPKALEFALEAYRAAPDLHLINYFVGEVYYHNQDYQKSLEHLLKSISQEERHSTVSLAYLSNIYYQLGDHEKSQEFRIRVEARDAEIDGSVNISRAVIAAVQDGPEDVVSFLEKSYNAEEANLSYIMNGDPLFKPFYDLPRFIDIRKKMQFYN